MKVRCFFLLLQMFHPEIENLKKLKWNSIVNLSFFFFTFFNMNSFNVHNYLQIRQLTDRNGERLVNFLRSCVYENKNCILLPSNIFLNILMCRKIRSPKFFFEHPQLKKEHFELNCLLTFNFSYKVHVRANYFELKWLTHTCWYRPSESQLGYIAIGVRPS